MTTEMSEFPKTPEERLIDYLAEDFKRQHGIDLRRDELALKRLAKGAQDALLGLSAKDVVDIYLPFIAATPKGPLHLKMRLTRGQLDEISAGR